MRELKSKSRAQPKKAPSSEPKPNAKATQNVTASWVGRVPPLKPGNYADGLPIHQVE